MALMVRAGEADGSVAPWQEVAISPEVGGFRIAEVLVNVGDRVRKGQPLATLLFNGDEPLVQVDVHLSPRFIQENLESYTVDPTPEP